MKRIEWEIQCIAAPEAVRWCKKCGGKTSFVPSSLFRVNAQGKRLDVWLLYQCSVCDTTWKLGIASRVLPDAIPAQVLDGFHSNDPQLARRCALDVRLLRRAGVEVVAAQYALAGEAYGWEGPAEIRVTNPFHAPVRLDGLLREKLGLSRRGFDAQILRGGIRCADGGDVFKRKVFCGDDCILLLDGSI